MRRFPLNDVNLNFHRMAAIQPGPARRFRREQRETRRLCAVKYLTVLFS
jgi:hypothetical protein